MEKKRSNVEEEYIIGRSRERERNEKEMMKEREATRKRKVERKSLDHRQER